MVSSSFYVSCSDTYSRLTSGPIFVLGSNEEPAAGVLITDALARGARVVVMEREKAGVYKSLCQANLREGVVYCFVRSLPATLSRWGALPLSSTTACDL